MTKKQREDLKPYERALTTSRSGYARITAADLSKVLEIYYGSDWQRSVPRNVLSCAYCKIRELKKIADEYFI